MKDKNSIVSVYMPTYNHDTYISQAIESVLMQETTFSYKLVIGDDCSTDKTASIVTKYLTQYPRKIKAILRPKNIGSNCNARRTLSQCTGKYVAMLEGDDYWTDPRKLQTQVDLLEQNPQLIACGHLCNIIDSKQKKIGTVPDTKLIKSLYTLEDTVIHGSLLHASSMVYRNILFQNIPKEMSEMGICGDVFWHILHAERGDIAFIPRPMSVYRLRSCSHAYSNTNKIDLHLAIANQWKIINHWLQGKYDYILSDKISGRYFQIAKNYLDQNNANKAKEYYILYKKFRTNYNYTTEKNVSNFVDSYQNHFSVLP